MESFIYTPRNHSIPEYSHCPYELWDVRKSSNFQSMVKLVLENSGCKLQPSKLQDLLFQPFRKGESSQGRCEHPERCLLKVYTPTTYKTVHSKSGFSASVWESTKATRRGKQILVCSNTLPVLPRYLVPSLLQFSLGEPHLTAT